MGFLKLNTYNKIKNGSNKEGKKFIKNKNLIKINKILSIILQIIENYFYFLSSCPEIISSGIITL